MPRQARIALVGAAGGVALLVVTWFAAFHVGVFKHADQSVFGGFLALGHRGWLNSLAGRVAWLCDPNPYVFFAVVPIAVAFARGRPRVALAVAAILLGANLTTELLKPLLAHPRPASWLGGISPVDPASWPSGHATAAMSLALASVLAAPARLRPLAAALGSAFAIAVSYSFLALGWHYPSDVLGGFLVAGIWALLSVAVLSAAGAGGSQRSGSQTRRRLSIREAAGPPVAITAGMLVLAGTVALARPHAVVAYARAHEVFLVGAAAIGALGLAMATGVMLALRR